MTNPDNVGGLGDHVPVPLSEELRVEAAMHSGDTTIRGIALVKRLTRWANEAEFMEQRIVELCRAAHAGGECQHEWQPDADVMNARYCPKCDVTQTLPRKSTKDSAPAGGVYAHPGEIEAARRNLQRGIGDGLVTVSVKPVPGYVALNSAPAGSGEVGPQLEMVEAYVRLYTQLTGHSVVVDLLNDYAALLRKLQQGAESVGTRQQTLRRLAGELEACDPDFTRGIAQSLRGRAYILDAVMTGSASQDQEGE